MTSRTTPVGAFVVALAGLIVAGCSAQTGAVFEALLAEEAAPRSASEAAPDSADAGAGDVLWWPHPDGYAMVLPEGWSGVAVDAADETRVLEALEDASPALAGRVDDVLDGTDSRISAIAADGQATGPSAPILVVLAQPTGGQPAHAVKSRVKEQISGLPGLSAGPFRNDVLLPNAKAVRFDFNLDDPDLGLLMVRAYLFRFGSDVYLVTFAAPAEQFDAVEAVFEAIAQSLRFGV
jgi:hypothetical protein